MNCKITVIGSYMTDLTVYADRFPSDGEAVHGSRFHIAHGGKGSNQAIAAHRAGADVIFIAKLGNDKFGFDALDFYTNR
jgi:ribokinase